MLSQESQDPGQGMLPIHCTVLYFLTGNGSTVGRWLEALTELHCATKHWTRVQTLPGSAGKVRRPIFLGRFFGEAGGKKRGGGGEEKCRQTIGEGGKRKIR